MIKRIAVSIGTAALALLAAVSAQAQSYSNAVQALKPVAYWPLQETTAPAAGTLYIATNSGTAGANANGYYETFWQTNGNPGALTNGNTIAHISGAIAADTDTAMADGAAGQYVVIPRTTNGVANPVVTLAPPYSLELWVFPTNTGGGTKAILAEGFNTAIVTNQVNVYGPVGSEGGTTIGMFNSLIYFNTFNFGTKNEIDTGNLAANKWYHLVATFDGTTMKFYTNGILAGTKVPALNAFGQHFALDTVSPLLIGTGNSLGNNAGSEFGGGIDEVAIYNSVLSQTQVTTHYNAGTNASPVTPYVQVVKNDSPSMYFRLDEPAFTGPALASLPVANNYGSLGASANGFYLPGATPGVTGPAFSGFGGQGQAVSLNGFSGGVDVGGGALPSQLNPMNGQPMTVTAWFKGNPSDAASRFQAIAGHSDSSWRLSFDNNAGNRFNPGNGPELQFANVSDEIANGMLVNDGNWHFIAGVSDGANDSMYIDGVLVKSGINEGAITNGSLQDVILGGDPQYLGPVTTPSLVNNGRWFDGSIAQVAFFTNALTSAQIASIYGAAGVAPSFRVPPVSAAVFQGLNASISSVAVGSGPLGYQWYTSGNTPVGGQTSSSLTFAHATPANAGSYYLVVANTFGAVTSSIVQLTVSANATSPYNTAIEQLNPIAYWPLSETVQPPAGQYVATNLGTLGSAANGYYQSWYQPITIGLTNTFFATNSIQHVTGATGDGDTGMACGNATGSGQYVVVPRATNGVANPATTITAPFSIEVWALTTNLTSTTLRPIVNQGRASEQNLATGTLTNEVYGFSLGQFQNFFYFQTYNGLTNNGGSHGNPEIDVHGILANTWYHLAVTYDGSTINFYTNGVLAASAASTFVPDPSSPLMIGSGTEPSSAMGGNEYGGDIDDVAIYSTVLTQAQVQAHFAAVGASYSSTVLADGPSIYYRLDEPAFNNYPDRSTYPVANNYGSLGAAANGAYMPGTTPGAAGPSYPGFDSSTAVAINGFYGGVDIGGGLTPMTLNPTGNQPQTVVAWFQTDPADSRFQEIVSRGDSSWRLAFDGNNNPGNSGNTGSSSPFAPHYNPGNNPELQFANINDVLTNGFFVNDGNWHMLAGVSDGNNVSMYIDGVLAKSGTGQGAVAGSLLDTMIGGSPAHTTPIWNSANLRYFDGQISQVAYFTNALNASQVQGLYSVAGVPLEIAIEPVSGTFNAGTSASIGVVVHGSSPAYQWYSTNISSGVVTPVTGQTNATLTFNPANQMESGFYFVVAANTFNTVTSTVAQVTIVGPPQIVNSSPNTLHVFVGTTPTLHVSVIAPSPFFQWFSNNVPIAGATNSTFITNSSYAMTNNDTSSVGNSTYTCVITNSFGSVTDTFAMTVLADPTAPYPARVLQDKPIYYYRLDEADTGYPNNGVIGYDYVGGENGSYSNTDLSQPGYSSATEPTETSAGFGLAANANSYLGNVPSYVDLATPTNNNAEFSIEAWVSNGPFDQTSDAGIVAIGYGFGGEQFALDTGGNDPNHDVRFYLNTASGANVGIPTSFSLNNNPGWHHLVAVCDEAAGKMSLYIDGFLAGSASVPVNSGLRTETSPLAIGARLPNATDNAYINQFQGFINDVAIYNYALTPAQVQSHYFVSGIAPVITQVAPVGSTNNPGSSASFTVTANGTQPLSYEWFDNNGNPINGQTSATLVLNNIQPSQAGTYSVAVANIYGTATTNVTLVVNQGPATIVTDLSPTNLATFAGSTATYTIVAGGDTPLFYQWFRNGTAIPNATNSTYTFSVLLGTNTYFCSVTNSENAGSPAVSSTGTVAGMPSTTLNPASYTDKMKITFPGYNLGQTLQDFPVLVQLNTSIPGFSYSHFASATGGDLRFTDAGGTVIIPSEIDEWNPDGTSIVWVQMPTLSSSNNFIWAYWGNPNNTTPLPGTNVWVPPSWQNVPGYDLVYHLKENGFPYIDSTGVNPSSTGNAPTQTSGLIGLGQSFASGSFLDVGSNNLSGQFTVSAWLNIPATSTSLQTLWANKVGGFNNAGFALYVNDFSHPGNGEIEMETGDGVSTGKAVTSASGAFGFNAWHLLTAVIDATNNFAWIYVDTNLVASTSIHTGVPTTNDVHFGNFLDGSFPMNGLIDEARIQFGTNSPAWIEASYMTVAQNSNLESYSPVNSTVVNPVTILFQKSGTNVVLDGSGGAALAGRSYTVLSSTNLALPLAQWTTVTNDTFNGSGNFSNAVPMNSTNKALFFRIAVP